MKCVIDILLVVFARNDNPPALLKPPLHHAEHEMPFAMRIFAQFTPELKAIDVLFSNFEEKHRALYS